MRGRTRRLARLTVMGEMGQVMKVSAHAKSGKRALIES